MSRTANPDAGDPMGSVAIGPDGPVRGRNDAKNEALMWKRFARACPGCGLDLTEHVAFFDEKDRRFDAKPDPLGSVPPGLESLAREDAERRRSKAQPVQIGDSVSVPVGPPLEFSCAPGTFEMGNDAPASQPLVDWASMTAEQVAEALASRPAVFGPWMEWGHSTGWSRDEECALDERNQRSISLQPSHPGPGWNVSGFDDGACRNAPDEESAKALADHLATERGWKLRGGTIVRRRPDAPGAELGPFSECARCGHAAKHHDGRRGGDGCLHAPDGPVGEGPDGLCDCARFEPVRRRSKATPNVVDLVKQAVTLLRERPGGFNATSVKLDDGTWYELAPQHGERRPDAASWRSLTRMVGRCPTCNPNPNPDVWSLQLDEGTRNCISCGTPYEWYGQAPKWDFDCTAPMRRRLHAPEPWVSRPEAKNVDLKQSAAKGNDDGEGLQRRRREVSPDDDPASSEGRGRVGQGVSRGPQRAGQGMGNGHLERPEGGDREVQEVAEGSRLTGEGADGDVKALRDMLGTAVTLAQAALVTWGTNHARKHVTAIAELCRERAKT